MAHSNLVCPPMQLSSFRSVTVQYFTACYERAAEIAILVSVFGRSKRAQKHKKPNLLVCRQNLTTFSFVDFSRRGFTRREKSIFCAPCGDA